MGNKKAFEAYNHGKNVIDLKQNGPSNEMRPTQLHHKENGAKDGKPSFVIVMEHPMLKTCYGQLTLEMLDDTLQELGYTIITTKLLTEYEYMDLNHPG